MADRAQEILDDCDHRQIAHPRYECCGRCDGPCRACADRAVEAAREEEREACALIAERWNNRAIPSPIAAAIRARGGKPNG